MIGFIGGSGLYKMEGLSDVSEREIETPFGKPSTAITLGKLSHSPVAFLPRHGKTHSLLPHEINYRANIWALKSADVTQIVSVSAVGSLTEEIRPGDISIVQQYFDWTRGRRQGSFFGEGVVAHVSPAEPLCPSLSRALMKVGKTISPRIHDNVTYACVDGPRFGTRAESFFLRQINCQLVGMTNLPEAFLAREAQICYASLAVTTDYDCWMEGQHPSLEEMFAIYGKSLATVHNILGKIALDPSQKCTVCRHALSRGMISKIESLPPTQRSMVEVLLK